MAGRRSTLSWEFFVFIQTLHWASASWHLCASRGPVEPGDDLWGNKVPPTGQRWKNTFWVSSRWLLRLAPEPGECSWILLRSVALDLQSWKRGPFRGGRTDALLLLLQLRPWSSLQDFQQNLNSFSLRGGSSSPRCSSSRGSPFRHVCAWSWSSGNGPRLLA